MKTDKKMDSIADLLPLVQIILSVALIALILLQRSDAGVGGAFGDQGGNGSHFRRRGFEKTLFQSTIILAILFALSAFAALLL